MPVEALPGLKDLVKYDVRKQPDLGGIHKPPSFLRETVIIAKLEVLPTTTPLVITAESISSAIPTSGTDLVAHVSDKVFVSRVKSDLNHESTVSLTLSQSRHRKDSLSKHRAGRGGRPRCRHGRRMDDSSHQCEDRTGKINSLKLI